MRPNAALGRPDPRIYQILVLATLLAYGLLLLRFEVDAAQVLLTLGSALAAQWICTRAARLPRFDPKSALISGLSLCLLLRADSVWLVPAIAAATIASKFLLRLRGKHVWNPTNFGLAFGMAALGGVWVSPGQWGSVAFFGFLVACLGGLVVNRAARSDVTLAFLASYVAILVARSLWLGEPMTIPAHRLANGAFLIFAFFMISDPKTTPDRRAGRILFAVLVSAGAAFVTFVLNRTNGLIWSLAALAPAVPLIDRILPGPRYAWSRPAPDDSPKGALHERPDVPTPAPLLPAPRRVGAARP
ncbi:MAG: RnfABCDGE type electron transport complex subunit D [Hyphomicrobiales bacterium]